MQRRLKAMLDVERASICRYRHQWMSTLFYLARSFVRAPRITIQLRRFWAAKRTSPLTRLCMWTKGSKYGPSLIGNSGTRGVG
jgi:hypothetical protein